MYLKIFVFRPLVELAFHDSYSPGKPLIWGVGNLDHYIGDSIYDRLVAAIVALKPCPFTGEREAYDVRLLLGEEGGLWPARIEPGEADDAVAFPPTF